MFEIKDEADHAKAKELLGDIDLAIRHEEALRRPGGLIWMAMTDLKRSVHDRYLQILTAKQTRIENLLTETTCQGCDDFVEYGSLHDDVDCMKQCRIKYKEAEDSRIWKTTLEKQLKKAM